MNITFTLTAETSGTTQSGDYRISGTTDGGAVNGVFIASGITRAQLTTGYTATGLSDSLTGGTITSTGSASGGFCTNQVTWYVTEPASPCECYTVYNEAGDRSIIFQYPRCSDGTVVSQSLAQGAVISVCVEAGGDIIDSSGLLTAVGCGTTCTVNGDCSDCN
jgi:hypothetical protein